MNSGKSQIVFGLTFSLHHKNAELETLKKFYVQISELAKKDNDLFSSHPVDEAADVHKEKINNKKKKNQSAKTKIA